MIIVAIIPTFNRKEKLETILRQLSNQNKLNYLLEVIIVVDGSTDGTIGMLEEKYSLYHIVQGSGEWWYTKSINEGFKFAKKFKPDFVLTLNDDLEIDSNYIQSLLNDSLKSGKECIMGSVCYTISKPHKISFGGVYKFDRWSLKEHHYIPKHTKCDPALHSGIKPSINLPGRGILIPFSLLQKLGYFDEKFVQYGSDTDFTLRATKNGSKVYISYNSIVYENEKLTSKGAAYNSPTFKEFFLSYFNKYSTNSFRKSFLFWKKHGITILFPIFLIKLLVSPFKVYYFKYRNR